MVSVLTAFRLLSLVFAGLVLCAPAGAQEQAPAVEIPRTQSLTMTSELLGRSYGLRIQLPPSYDSPEAADRSYPVLYLNDVHAFYAAAGITQLPMSSGIIEELIVVGVGYEQGVGGQSRIRDYTPTDNPAWEQPTGGAGAYLEFIERELIPFIETTYRADPQRRALGGHSLGGLFGSYVLFSRPELFQHYILSSPSFWFHENVTWSFEEAYAADHEDMPAKVYLSVGGLENPADGGSSYEMVADVFEFERRLRSREYEGLEIRATAVDGLNHETVFPVVLLNALLWHFAVDRDMAWSY